MAAKGRHGNSMFGPRARRPSPVHIARNLVYGDIRDLDGNGFGLTPGGRAPAKDGEGGSLRVQR